MKLLSRRSPAPSPTRRLPPTAIGAAGLSAGALLGAIVVQVTVLAGSPVQLEAGPAMSPFAAATDVGGSRGMTSPALARDPRDPNTIVVATTIDGASRSAALAWTDDGGRHWGLTALPLPPGLDQPTSPDLAFGPDGTLYVVYVDLHGVGGTPAHLWLSHSRDGGRHLAAPVLLSGPLAFEDRLAVGPDGSIIVTWLQANGVGQWGLVGDPSPIVAIHSTDGGQTFSAPVRVSDPGRIRVGAATPVVMPDGSIVIVYEDFRGDVRDFLGLEGPVWPDPFALVVTRSTDGGQSFARGQEIDAGVVATRRFVAYEPQFPSVAAGPDGSLVVVWEDARTGRPDVLLRRSTDAGKSWSPPVIVDPSGPKSVEHRLPTVSVAPNGRIDVLFLDNRRDPGGRLLDAELASSNDEAARFVTVRLTDRAVDPGRSVRRSASFLPPDLGSRLALLSTDDHVLAAWPETATGRVDVASTEVSQPGGMLPAVLTSILLVVGLAAGVGAVAAVRPGFVASARAVAATSAAVVLAPRPRPAPIARPAPRSQPVLRLGSRAYPVFLPHWRDPRLHVAGAIMSVQILGQLVLGFNVTAAQILLCLGVCGLLEVVVTLIQRQAIVWPASALLTGNGVALILRVPGTQHGDWWSLHGADVYVITAVVSLLSKYLVRIGGRHVFNPSNLGLVITFLVFGSQRSDPQDLWWGALSPGLSLTLAIIVVPGLLIVRRLGMLPMVLAFAATWAALAGVMTAGGHCITARWHVGPVCGEDFWSILVTSPEILIFALFMITDPQTSPAHPVGRLVYGAAVAFFAAIMVAPQSSEFAVKVAILGALVLVCALRPVVATLSSRVRLPLLLDERSRKDVQGLGASSSRLGGDGGAVVRWTSRRSLVTVPAALLAVGLAAGSVAAAATPVRGATPRDGQAVASRPRPSVPRPAVPLDVRSLPAVQVSPEVLAARPTLGGAAAARLARDVVEDLLIEALAVERLDSRLATTAALGRPLEGVVASIDAARRGGRRVVPRYHFDRLTVVLAHDPTDYQSPPQIALELQGTEEDVTYAGLTGTHELSRSTVPYHRIYAVELVAGHYLLIADDTPRVSA